MLNKSLVVFSHAMDLKKISVIIRNCMDHTKVNETGKLQLGVDLALIGTAFSLN